MYRQLLLPAASVVIALMSITALTPQAVVVVVVVVVVHPFFEQWFLPFRRKLFCFLSKFKNKNRFEILVQFPD